LGSCHFINGQAVQTDFLGGGFLGSWPKTCPLGGFAGMTLTVASEALTLADRTTLNIASRLMAPTDLCPTVMTVFTKNIFIVGDALAPTLATVIHLKPQCFGWW
jgi:hypothetical protein